MKRGLIFLLFLVLMASIACAHQPRIAFGENIAGNITRINNPEVSQAYYGILKGMPDLYKISSDINFSLYLNILVPQGAENDYSVAVFLASESIHPDPVIVMDGTNFTWTPFFEDFAGDNYLKGPESRNILPAGTYEVKVYSPDNIGKYALAVGEKEEFPLGEILNAFLVLPKIKTDFFGKPWISAYTNKIGLFLLAALIIIGALIVFAVMMIIRFIRDMKSEKEAVIVK
jgi:hypothetical protein